MNHESSWDRQKQDFESLCRLWDQAQADGIFTERNSPVESRADFFGNYQLPEDQGIQNNEAEYWSNVLSRSAELVPDESMMLMEAAKKKVGTKKTAKKSKSAEKDLDQQGVDAISKETKKFAKAKSGKGGDTATGDYDVTAPYKRVKTSVETDDIPSLVKKVKVLANEPQKVDPGTFGPDSTDQDNTNYVTAGWAGDPNYDEIEKLKHDFEKAERMMSGLTGLDNKKIKELKKEFRDLRKKIDKVSSNLVANYRKNRYYN